MAYKKEERETLVHYDEFTDEWTIETNSFKHMGTLLRNQTSILSSIKRRRWKSHIS
jgi:hypothetical protein